MAKKLGLDEARAIAEAILRTAAEKNLQFAAAVVDSGGELIYLARMDGASPLNARMSVNKAYTATKWRRNTKEIKERLFDIGLGDDRRDIAWFGDRRFTAVWGGILLRDEAGAVLGVSPRCNRRPAGEEVAAISPQTAPLRRPRRNPRVRGSTVRPPCGRKRRRRRFRRPAPGSRASPLRGRERRAAA
jgi:glc operon protein GlcG